MNHPIRRLRRAYLLLPLALGFLALAGCEAPKPAATAPTPAQASPDAVTRTTAIQNAQRDASFRYSEVRVARVDARRFGGYWVVELTSTRGSGLRYTISALDGTIRERNMFQ